MGCTSSTHFEANLLKEYEVFETLGEGVFGAVFAARHVASGKDVAIKVLRTDGESPATVRMAHREVLILRRLGLGCENCIRFLDAFFNSHEVLIVMEKCATTLVRVLEACDPTETLLRRLLRDMLKGIAFIHSAGVMHRDVKIDNFLCSHSVAKKRAVVKLCDFGFSGQFGGEFGKKFGGVYGTAPYMSPEMIRGEHDEKTDVWSLGVLTYVLLLGDFPYTASEDSSEALKKSIIKGKPLPSFFPSNVLIPTPSKSAVDFVSRLLLRGSRARPAADECLKHEFVRVGPSKDASARSLRHAFGRAGKIGAYTYPAKNETSTRLHLQGLSFASEEEEILAYETVVDGTVHETVETSKLRGRSATKSSVSTADSLPEAGTIHTLSTDTMLDPTRDDGRSLSLASPVSTMESFQTCSSSPIVPAQGTCSFRAGSGSCGSDPIVSKRHSPESVLTMDVLPTFKHIPEETGILSSIPTKVSL